MPEKEQPQKKTPPPTDPKVMPSAMLAHENMKKTPVTPGKIRRL